jgi:hypothetical protein
VKQFVAQNSIAQWSYTSDKRYADPFNDVTLEVMVTDPGGNERRVPAFWAGEGTWTVRYASPLTGEHHFRTLCSDTRDGDLHGHSGVIGVTPYEGRNPLLQHGPLRLAADRRHLEHADGAPFFWLGDTWWMGFCRRLSWPDDFTLLATDRAAKGFTVIQIVAGLYPDMPAFDPRGANEAGYPWEEGFARINPAYFDQADLRLAHLVRAGLAPCIVGSWGYYLDFAGPEVLKRHWRYLIARWGAYPVIWCVAGEALMPYYAPAAGGDAQRTRTPDELRAFWTELAGTIRETDPFGRPVTIHPTRYGHDQVSDPGVLDLDMLQTGHSGYPTLPDTIDFLETALSHPPAMPVLVAEADYEGILESSREEVQRFLFWSCLLSGAAGHTYGANGLWQVNSREQPYGPSPHGTSWGEVTWEEAYRLPGSGQVGLGKHLLERYPWQQFEPHPEWITPHQSPGNRIAPYAAGLPDGVRLFFIPSASIWAVWSGQATLNDLAAGRTYRAAWFDPKTGREHAIGPVLADDQGAFTLPRPPIFQDWVIVLEPKEIYQWPLSPHTLTSASC